MPRSAPFASASLMVCFTRSGPMESAMTSPPCFSFRRSASSSAKLSGSFISKPISDSRIQFPAMDSGASFAGTCLMHTIMFTGLFLFAAVDKRPKTYLVETKTELLAGPALENQRRVGAAKSEGVRERVFDGSFARFVGDVVQIASRVRRFLVNGRRQDLIAQGQHADPRLQAARSPQQMPGHRFRRTHGNLLGSLTENSLQGYRFEAI